LLAGCTTDRADGTERGWLPSRAATLVAPAAPLLLGACASLGNAPPLHEVERDLPGGVEVERGFLGFVEERRLPSGDRESAVRPLLVERVDTQGNDFLSIVPPVASHTVSDFRRRWTVWPLFASDSAGTEAERARGESDDDTWLLPLVAWGSEPGAEDRMLFPVYGHLHQKLFSDEIEFAAFPVWARTKTGGWESTHVLWPLIAWGDGDGRSHRRFLPFWSQTDGPNGSKRTAAWPFVHWGTEQRGDRTFDGWFVFPLAGHRTSRDGSYSETTALWPFFEWSDDASNGDSYRGILWPFHKEMDRPSKGESSTWWWPVHGNYRSETETSEFWAWPLVWSAEFREERRTSRRFFVVPLWMDRESGPKDGPSDRREIRSWPLFSFERTPEGLETVRVPEIIPFFGWKAGETAWADLVALFRWSSDREGRASWDGPLGGIVRWRRDATGASKLTLLWWIDIPTGDGR
jgi:hypothetical protein